MFNFKNKNETFQKFSNFFPPHSNVYQKPLPSALSSWIRQRTSTLSTRQRALLFFKLEYIKWPPVCFAVYRDRDRSIPTIHMLLSLCYIVLKTRDASPILLREWPESEIASNTGGRAEKRKREGDKELGLALVLFFGCCRMQLMGLGLPPTGLRLFRSACLLKGEKQVGISRSLSSNKRSDSKIKEHKQVRFFISNLKFLVF